MNGNTAFHERQRMLQPWASVVLTVAMLILEVVVVIDYLGYVNIDQTDIVTLSIVTAVVIFVIGLALLLKMDVTVDGEYLSIRTIGTRRIHLEDIAEATVRDRIYAVREYGGWGIRLWTKGIGCVAPGNNGGVDVKVKSEKHGIMISSKDPEILLRALS